MPGAVATCSCNCSNAVKLQLQDDLLL
jgi:hypothetical protein